MSDHVAKRAKWLTTAGVAILVVAACGGTPAATAGPTTAAATQGSGATSVPATPGGATAPAATQTGGGGGGTLNGPVCGLLTAAEIEGVMGLSGVTPAETPLQNGSGYCLYKAGDDIAAATAVTVGPAAGAVWTTYSTSLGADGTSVSGIGDGAVFVHSSATLFVWKNGVLVGLTAGTGSADEATRLDWEKKLGAKIADKL